MKYTWIDEYLLGKPGVTKDFKELEPADGDFLRQQYEDIIPGYYMNKIHWNSVKADGEVPDDLLKDMLDKSYRLVLASLSKKKQKEILGDAADE